MPIPIMATLLICSQSAWVILNSSSFIHIICCFSGGGGLRTC